MTARAMAHRTDPLPDPDHDADFYADVSVKRLLAWFVDVIAISLMLLVIVLFTAFLGAFLLPLLWLTISFAYRWWSLAARSATPGMRLFNIEFRQPDGRHFDGPTAFFHTAGFTLSMAIFPLQLLSMALMVMSARGQGLTDHLMGTVAINRPA